MTSHPSTVLVVGATGSIGALVVAEADSRRHRTRALIRPGSDARFGDAVETIEGDLTDAGTLAAAVDGIDAVIFAHGSHGGADAAESVDYGAVRNILTALDGRPVRIALMTAIGVTKRTTGHDWKRRGERLVRASGNDYTVVRPGWFDYNDADQQRITMLQGDRRWASDPSDGVIARQQIAEVLVASLSSTEAAGKTLELVAERGPAPDDLGPLFAALDADGGRADLDAVRDTENLPTDGEPQRVLDDLAALRRDGAAS